MAIPWRNKCENCGSKNVECNYDFGKTQIFFCNDCKIYNIIEYNEKTGPSLIRSSLKDPFEKYNGGK